MAYNEKVVLFAIDLTHCIISCVPMRTILLECIIMEMYKSQNKNNCNEHLVRTTINYVRIDHALLLTLASLLLSSTDRCRTCGVVLNGQQHCTEIGGTGTDRYNSGSI